MPTDETANRDDRLPRVLMALDLDPSQKFGTLEEQVLALSRAFHERSGRFLPLYRRGLDPEGARLYSADGLDAAELDLTRFSVAKLTKLHALIRRHAIEIVHWNFYAPITNPYLWALSVLAPGVKHVYTDHISRPGSTPPPTPKTGPKAALKRSMAGRYAGVLAVSGFVHDWLKAEGTWPRVRLGTHFVNTDRFAPDELARIRVRDELGDGFRFVILAVAHLIPEKGVDVLVRACARLPQQAALWVIGDGPEAARLRVLADEQGVGDRVRWLGIRRHVEPYMQAADCLVCPSIWAEAAGLVNIEGLAAGLPVVASAIGGIPEIVAEGKTGFLVPPGDVEALADRLARLIDDPLLRREMATAARADALARYATKVVLPDYLEFYRSLHAGCPAARVQDRIVSTAGTGADRGE